MDKDNYKIINDLKPLSSEEINAHQDFEAILAQVTTPAVEHDESKPGKQRHLRRWLYPAISVAAAAIVGLLLYVGSGDSTLPTATSDSKAYFASQPFINPPIPSVKATYQTQKINGTQGGTYTYDNGSKVIVPADAFINAQGGLVEGEVEIHYREFHDYVDFFLSGIPMEYDSAGTQFQLESAGMIELYAEQNGERLKINPGKSIAVELVSDIYAKSNDPLDFNIYHLDTEKRNWVYDGKDQLEILPAEATTAAITATEQAATNRDEQLTLIAADEKTELAKIEKTIARPVAPVKPVRANESMHVFNLEFTDDMIDYGTTNVDPSQVSVDEATAALRRLQQQYKNTLWQVAPNQSDFNENAAGNIQWEDMKLKKLNNRDFELTLIGSANQMKVIVNPVLVGQDYQAAMAEFNNEFSAYQQELDDRETKLSNAKQTLQAKINERNRMAELAYEKRIAALKASGQDDEVTNELIKHKVVNRFRATRMGIWNCDRPLPPCLVRLKADFVGTDKKSFSENVAYLVDKDRNTVSRFYAKSGTELQFNKGSKKLMWIVTKENKLAVYNAEQFEAIKLKEKSHTFVLDVVDQPIETEEDVRRILML